MLSALAKRLPAVARIRRFLDHPVETQQRVLDRLLRRASETEWGLRLGFADILRETDVAAAYRSAVPLHGYEDIRDDVQRIRRGVPDVLWPGRVTHFAVSSGTASDGKLIPVSRETIVANRRFSMGTMYNYIATTGRTDFLFGKFLSLPGRIHEDPVVPGNWMGQVSGLQVRYAPRFVTRFMQAVDDDTIYMASWEYKLREVVRQTITTDVRSIATVPTWLMLLYEMLMEEHERLTGTKPETVRDVWPNLSLVFTGGVALSGYRAVLDEQGGAGAVDMLETYGASEGFFAFQLDPSDRDMALHLDNGIYYEFVELDGADSRNKGADGERRRLSIADVRPDVRYQMFVTTASGLWAYEVGDVVKFTSVDPYRIVVAGRTNEMLDVYGEALFGDEARDALNEACETTGARFVDYHISPLPLVRHGRPAHQWLIEFEREPDDTKLFVRVIDDRLRRVNMHYYIRREVALSAPEIVSLRRGTFYDWLDATRAEVNAQSKVPRMSEGRAIADRLLELGGGAE